MSIPTKVYLVRYRNSVIAVTSNLKTAYDWMMDEVPTYMKDRFKSYHQVNRILKKTYLIEFPIPDRDCYYIERQKLHSTYTPTWVGSAGVQPTRLRPIDRCGRPLLRG